MAAQSWPGTLPQDIRVPTTHAPGETNLRTKMDAGPKKVRRRFTAVEEGLTTTMVMDGTEYQALQTFYYTTLAGGSLRFDWTNPVDDATVEMRFTAPPEGVIISGGETPADRTWRVTLNLEIMP